MSFLAPSRYNFAVPSHETPNARVAVFNARTGALLVLGGVHSGSLATALLEPSGRFVETDFDSAVFTRLRRGGFLIDDGCNELALVQERYWRARGDTPIVFTITTTMDCNLGCYYCYEERSGARLEAEDVSQIVEMARSRLAESGKRALHVDWYGGEPLLNLPFIEAASRALQDFCADADIAYVASIISNGSVWPEDVEDFVDRHRIRQVQISFDGLQANHDKRRRFRRGHRPVEGDNVDLSAFSRAVALVDRLVWCVRVDLRFNIDSGNKCDLIPFIRLARRRGWFAALHPAVLQPARLAAYSNASAFMRARELTLEEFDALRAEARREIGGDAAIEESEVPDGFPHPKFSVCAALAPASAVIGADGLVYRCGLQVGERKRAVSSLARLAAAAEPSDTHPDAAWWQTFDPTTQPTCSRCSFLPICWGGCPKKHLEDDGHALREQGRYWRKNLPRLLAGAAGFAATGALSELDERLQFR